METKYVRTSMYVDAIQMPRMPIPTDMTSEMQSQVDKTMVQLKTVMEFLNERGYACVPKPGFTIYAWPDNIVHAPEERPIKMQVILAPEYWAVIEQSGELVVMSNEEFRRMHQKVDERMVNIATLQLNLHVTPDELPSFKKQLEIGRSEGFESPLGTAFLQMIENYEEKMEQHLQTSKEGMFAFNDTKVHISKQDEEEEINE